MIRTDTIAAIATAMSNAGIGIIRISGPEAVEVADRIFQGSYSLKEAASHTIHYGHIVYDGHTMDEVLVAVMLAPKTYTREDTVEIDCHGGVLVERKILDAVLSSGARLAEPGEFTKRAFLNGRIDLSQAESVMDLISSDNDYALQSSVEQLSGVLSEQVHSMRDAILYETAYIESALDDPEHYDLEGYSAELSKHLLPVQKQLQTLIDSARDGAFIKEGIRTAIVGRPNAGKSSLLNALARKERAIVTDIPGTTRDTLEEKINIDGITLQLIDTAGIRDTQDTVEKIGVERAFSSMEHADLIIYVVDGTAPLNADDDRIIAEIKNREAVVLLNKEDLTTVIDPEELTKMTGHRVISISAKEHEGLEDLADYIRNKFFHGKIRINEEMYITNARQEEALKNAAESLDLVQKSISDGMPEDLYTVDLMDAYEQLGLITGESVEDDLADEIFSKFCMGK